MGNYGLETKKRFKGFKKLSRVIVEILKEGYKEEIDRGEEFKLTPEYVQTVAEEQFGTDPAYYTADVNIKCLVGQKPRRSIVVITKRPARGEREKTVTWYVNMEKFEISSCI